MTSPVGEPAAPFDGVGRLVGIATEVVAPATLVTALLFYFGYRRTSSYFDYFGVNLSVLEFSNRDYFMRSVEGLYLPLGAVGVFGLVLMWGYVALPKSARAASAGWAWLAPLAAVVGLLLVLNGISRLFWITPFNSGLTVAPVCIIVGVLILWYVIYHRRKRLSGSGSARRPEAAAMAEWAVIFVVVSLSLFWAVDNYASAVGRERAAILASALKSEPRVVVYSDKQLDLDPSGTTEIHCPEEGLVYPYRYEGLVLILKVGNSYTLVPASWNETNGTAIVLSGDATDALRFEFVMPGVATVADKC